MHQHGREGAKQPRRFNPERAKILDDPARFAYLPVADVLALLDPPHGGLIVDFGTGTGTYAIEIAKLRPDVRIIALDEQPEMLDMLRAKLENTQTPGVEPASSDAVPALRERADAVLALNVLHELGDSALGDLRSLLRQSARVAFIDWNAEVERPVGPPGDHVYSPSAAKDRLEKNRFRVVFERRFAYQYALLAQLSAEG